MVYSVYYTPLENIDICNKRKKLQQTEQQKDSHPTMKIIRQFKRAQKELELSYEKKNINTSRKR